MFLQGHLQKYFDALFQAGVIEPLLKMEWREIQDKKEQKKIYFDQLLTQLNQIPDQDLLAFFNELSKDDLYAIAMEVASEYVQFTDRKNALH